MKLRMVVPVCLSSAVCEMEKGEKTGHVWKAVCCLCIKLKHEVASGGARLFVISSL
jgi:hypothetical protein